MAKKDEKEHPRLGEIRDRIRGIVEASKLSVRRMGELLGGKSGSFVHQVLAPDSSATFNSMNNLLEALGGSVEPVACEPINARLLDFSLQYGQGFYEKLWSDLRSLWMAVNMQWMQRAQLGEACAAVMPYPSFGTFCNDCELHHDRFTYKICSPQGGTSACIEGPLPSVFDHATTDSHLLKRLPIYQSAPTA